MFLRERRVKDTLKRRYGDVLMRVVYRVVELGIRRGSVVLNLFTRYGTMDGPIHLILCVSF